MKTSLFLISLLFLVQCQKEEMEFNYIEISPILRNGEIPPNYKVTILAKNLHQETRFYNSRNNENFYDAEQTTYIQTFIIHNPQIDVLYKTIVEYQGLQAIDSIVYTGGIMKYETVLKND